MKLMEFSRAETVYLCGVLLVVVYFYMILTEVLLQSTSDYNNGAKKERGFLLVESADELEYVCF